MINPVFKAAGMGVFAGWILFAFPFFLLKSIIFIFLFGLMFRMFIGRKLRRAYGSGFSCRGGGMRERFKNMTEEEKKEFFSKMKHRRCHRPETDEEGFVKPINK